MLKKDLIHYLKKGKSGHIDTKEQGLRRINLERLKLTDYQKLRKMFKNIIWDLVSM